MTKRERGVPIGNWKAVTPAAYFDGKEKVKGRMSWAPGIELIRRMVSAV